MLSERIREGQDIFFVCLVDAQPAVSDVEWLHEGRPLNESLSLGPAGGHLPKVIISNNSLVLQRVRLGQAGRYGCLASNSEGVSASNEIELRVLRKLASSSLFKIYPTPVERAPPCRQRQQTDFRSRPTHKTKDAPICVRSSSVGEEEGPASRPADHLDDSPEPLLVSSTRLALKSAVRFRCEMLAEPADRVEFVWYLNNTSQERRVLLSTADTMAASGAQTPSEPERVGRNGSATLRPDTNRARAGRLQVAGPGRGRSRLASSQLNFRVETSSDYGQLYCVARNSAGEQKRACLYRIEQSGGCSVPLCAASAGALLIRAAELEQRRTPRRAFY